MATMSTSGKSGAGKDAPGESAPRHCVVTGALGGIGAAVVTAAKDAGYRVTSVDQAPHRHSAGAKDGGRIGDGKRNGAPAGVDKIPADLPVDYILDVTDAEAARTTIDRIEADRGPIDVLIHTAGILRADAALDGDTDAMRASFEVNMFGAVHVCAPVSRRMCERKRGAIVVVSSNAGTTPRAGMGSYGASKAAITAWARNLGLECAPHGVRVNIVSPGSTDTPMLRGMWPAGEDRSADVIAGTPDQYRLGIPLQRLAQPEDIAGACLYLASDNARHIVMHDLRVDGGAMLDS
ncbi:MAG: SDR family oxidoreductase [Corynebacterium kroppenstedtii]|nr:SDR family oxidoreductase [Corynebacterium kroppenstedtii]